MKRLLYILLGLFLALVVLVLVMERVDPAPALVQQPVAEVAAVPVLDADTVATEPVSPSSAFSRKLRGVFIKSVTCTPNRIPLGDSIDVEIKEAWLEKIWELKSGGIFGEPDFSRGYAVDSLSEHPRTQLVLAYSPASKLGHYEQYSWRISRADDGIKIHSFGRSRGNQLVMYFLRSNAVFPIKYYVSYCAKQGLDCPYVKADSLLISE